MFHACRAVVGPLLWWVLTIPGLMPLVLQGNTRVPIAVVAGVDVLVWQGRVIVISMFPAVISIIVPACKFLQHGL